MTRILLAALLALAVSGATGPLTLALLRRAAVLDHPSERSSHRVPVPRGGGVGPAVAALIALAASSAFTDHRRWALILAVGVFAVLGLVEDIVGIPALPRLGLQFVLGTVVAALLLDGLSGPAAWRVLFAFGSVLWLVGFVNAFNFMDGIDGISVAQAVGGGVTWVVVGRLAGVPLLASGGAVVAGAALGFAPFNLPRARMFLGDVGSYFFGACLAALALAGLRAGVAPEAILAPLALYVADTGTTLARRVRRGERWYLPHRDHTYQRLTDIGWSHPAVALGVGMGVVACGALGAVSLAGSLAARLLADVAIIAIVGGYLLSPRWLARTRHAVAVA